ncbi:uncharacterized protein ColSpa_03080 [Colletotrichum spaethianum]|uniref:Uncharacterized protein n=1 Tax=Colletotrichum spaethianum TaxID=700344 RepID=A0AA37LA84_9PEZI|nr:uncharacterized protein ColSpa_03080 [Colletotrichum spaethianum]GKT42899.1 hypothetical protein ColSpa_03080 [Colletotrichum spaethianum]
MGVDYDGPVLSRSRGKTQSATSEQKPDDPVYVFPLQVAIPVLSRVHRKTRHKKETPAEAKTREKPE